MQTNKVDYSYNIPDEIKTLKNQYTDLLTPIKAFLYKSNTRHSKIPKVYPP